MLILLRIYLFEMDPMWNEPLTYTFKNYLNRNFLNLGIIESRNYIRISYDSFLYAGTNGISPFS